MNWRITCGNRSYRCCELLREYYVKVMW